MAPLTGTRPGDSRQGRPACCVIRWTVKIVVFGPEKRVGVWTGDFVVDLARASAANPGVVDATLPRDLLGLIEGGAQALADAGRIVETVMSAAPGTRAANGVHAVADVTLHAPQVPGARVACAGGNFADHMAAMAKRSGRADFDTSSMEAVAKHVRSRGIWGFWKVGRDAAGPGAGIMYPSRTKRLDYEGELAIVLGKPAKDAKAADIASYVWGVTLFGDWSIRDQNEGTATFKFAMAKNFDGSYSVGPCIVVNEGIDPANVDIETYVNGDRRQHFNTRDMVISFGEYLEYLSTDLTLQPGDMISGGTAAGTAADSSERSVEGVAFPERFLKAGDSVEMISPAIGTLAARIVAKP
jgi:2-keto-4-pentenoate hydratase/2-oxohepta-3-ene-1,7-dioic acid hydratase in catechol pathway